MEASEATIKGECLGQAEIRKIFKAPKVARLRDARDGGVVKRGCSAPCRDGIVIWEGTIASLAARKTRRARYARF